MEEIREHGLLLSAERGNDAKLGFEVMRQYRLDAIGTAFAYVMWFRGIAQLAASTTAFLGLLSPVVAILLGWIIAGENLTPMQIAGIVIVLSSISAAIISRRTHPSCRGDADLNPQQIRI